MCEIVKRSTVELFPSSSLGAGDDGDLPLSLIPSLLIFFHQRLREDELVYWSHE